MSWKGSLQYNMTKVPLKKMIVSCLTDTFCDADPEKMVNFLMPITSVRKVSKLEEIYANELNVGGVSVTPPSG